MNHFSKATLLASALALCACSALESDKVDYRAAAAVKTPNLEVPPDLAQLSNQSQYTVVDGGVSALSKKNTQAAIAALTVAPNTVNDVRIERAGNERWLVVKRPAEALWSPIREFWLDSGFQLAMDDSSLGIMETDWAENRAKIPMDAIRATIGKWLDSLYSTPERDKYRTRLERDANGDTEIFISHRGMMEIYTKEAKEDTIWQPRPQDPELETEFLRRLMIKLGVSAEQAKAMLSNTPSQAPAAVVADSGNQVTLRINDGFDRAWRRVGLALDRTGFTVEDRDRSKGLYFVRYIALNAEGAAPGFFSKLFKSKPAKDGSNKYQIAVRTSGDFSTVSVLNENGLPETSETAQRIVKVLADDIK